MAEIARRRVILQRESGSSPTAREIEREIASDKALAIVEEGEELMLVEGEDEAVERLAKVVKGWRLVPLRSIPRPDARKRVLRPPSGDY
ncbi:MAG: hypothetical protein AB7O57_01855 [Hyphomicrobiaceae bacterium]